MTAPVSDTKVSMVVRYLADEAGVDCVTARVEGQTVLLTFDIDSAEHNRRQATAVGAVRSRRLLHALWALPRGIPWAVASLDDFDVDTLEAEGAGFVEMEGDVVERLYQPPGRVTAVGLRRRQLVDALSAAGRFPPIYSRYGIGPAVSSVGEESLAAAQMMGVGAILVAKDSMAVLAQAAPPVAGVPGVYRWWLAEIAYEAWLS